MLLNNSTNDGKVKWKNSWRRIPMMEVMKRA